MPHLRFAGSTRVERNAMIDRANAAIGTAGGWIIDHTLFSNLMITLTFSLPADKGIALRDALAAAGLTLHDPAQ